MLIGAAVAVILLGVPAVASAKPAPVTCSSLTSGTVKLTGDLSCASVEFENGTLDLGGHTLTSDDVELDRATIKHGTIVP
jgi:hypothetical protein